MKTYTLLLASSLLLLSCSNDSPMPANTPGKLAGSLRDAVISYHFDFKEADMSKMYALGYFTYLHQADAIKSLEMVDSIKIETLWLVFYKYSINGRDFHKADWFINIKGHYFYAGLYVSEYNAETYFSSDNIELGKALIKKADAWEKKSEQQWWKYID